ncbi:sigma-54-dependent Fis family transcriptional regulator [candidate division WOR-3 bacterium]|nr:sigma-54-dependent Fis family transcriptional regulator [candidate division WOR-3 bacterium]
MSEQARTTILAVDDSAATLEVLRRNLEDAGYRVLTAQAVPDAIALLDSNPVELVITDLKMPKVSGMDLVRHVRENFRATEVIMITGYATVSGAVEAVKTGADEYLAKPFTSDELLAAVRRSLGKLSLRRVGNGSSKAASFAPHGLIGESAAMQEVFRAINKAAATAATVLITGESGTGKELVARAVHYSGSRSSAPFVPVNCGGIPEGLLESELFGYVKGAFTGAAESRAGFFQTADGGTIFLDEIGETSPSMQVKLLRVLQDREVCMVGDARARRVDVRVIAATNKDLLARVRKGAFREDLFFRLNVITVVVPPLRDRDEDTIILARHFVERFAREYERPVPEFTDDALRILRGYAWPGNVRELENLVQRLVVMGETERIDVPDLPGHMRFAVQQQADLTRTLAEVEAEYVRNVLASVEGNKTRAAEILGIDRKTLRSKLEATEQKPED